MRERERPLFSYASSSYPSASTPAVYRAPRRTRYDFYPLTSSYRNGPADTGSLSRVGFGSTRPTQHFHVIPDRMTL
jgi:hypothetical protein